MKLAPATIYTFGVSIAVIAFAYGFFQQWLPNREEAKMYDAVKEEQDGVIAQKGKADKKVADARALVATKAAQWQGFVETKTPSKDLRNGGIDISVDPYQLALDTPKFRNSVQRAINAQLKKGGVTVVNGPFVPGLTQTDSVGGILATYYNYPAFPFPIVIYDLGTVTLRGTYKQIADNVRAWSRMPRYLAITDALAISGTSPNLQATYNLSLVGFIRGDKVFGPIPEGAGGAATAGGPPGGFPGGPPGGFPGGPPGGFRGGPPGGFPGGPPGGFPGGRPPNAPGGSR